MSWVLLLLLPLALRPGRAGPSQARAPLFRLTQQGSWGGGGSNATGSPCEGLPDTGTTAWSLANRSLERLPGCLPRALRSLDGSHNRLRALSARELGHLPQLQVLTLSHNLVAELRWGPGGPAELHTLDLSYNRLEALPPCSAPAPRSLRALHLAGNPLQELQPGAFSCFPELLFLNLSSTALGRGGQEGIAEAAFALEGGARLESLEVLDLSGTFLTRVRAGWIRDLPKLTTLYLRNMPGLRSLEGDIFKMTPELRVLDCQDSPALTSVHTHIFQDTPRLQVLLFQNCNLSSFPPWTLNSSQVLSISLYGNPLTCSCELSWLLLDAKRTVLNRANNTVCTPAAGSRGPFSAALALPQLPGLCQLDQNTTDLTSHPASSYGSTHAPPAQGTSPGGPSTLPSTAPSTRPARGQQRVTKASSLPVESLTQAARPHSSGTEGVTHSTPGSTAASGHSGGPPRATATTGSKPGEERASSTPFTTKPLGLFPPSRKPVSTPQPILRTPATPEAPQPSPSEGGIPILLLDDYSEEEEEEVMETSPQDVPCDYHPCKHLQIPCSELQRRSRCRCPGLSGEDTVPDSPKLRGLTEVTDTSVLVHWCAPNSAVRGYQIRYHAEGRPGNQSLVGEIYATARQHPLYGLSPATTYRVCVLAANRAGLSQPRAGWRGACAAFTTKPSAWLALAGLGASCGLLLAGSLLLAACLCRRGRAARRERCPTHLVAYRNPAFDHPLQLPTFD
ncbi:leucine-rich repeat neuronal protein 4 [Choloepus didactylus]|uniref:leucine-rich repeat neuronal protein 4 n=1 Tax=Choloepus didactylus TaxID=27675 RepID=UPI00189E9CE6|nr:leucine-rich repeat neuronal protein 4 [Choloepus didactylus]